MERLSVAIALFEGVEELDWVGPWEVIAMWASEFPDDNVEVFTVSQIEGPVTCAEGVRVLGDYSWENCPPVDVLIYPGGPGARRQVGNGSVRSWVRERNSKARVVASVCTGALVLADAGLLDGLPATTHWRAMDLLASLGNDIDVRPDDRFVDAGDIITAAGVSAGIDMALHLVARLHSVERARDVRRAIQYDPESPI